MRSTIQDILLCALVVAALFAVATLASGGPYDSCVPVRCDGRPNGSGAYVVYRGVPLILTAAHVAGPARSITITDCRGNVIPCTMVVHDAQADVAVLRPSQTPAGQPSAIAPDNDSPYYTRTGHGFFGNSFTICRGRAIAIPRDSYPELNPNYAAFRLQHYRCINAPSNHGDSGGAIYDSRGYVAGLVKGGRDGYCTWYPPAHLLRWEADRALQTNSR